jgi:ATP-binding cassette subfamily B protein
LVRKAGDGLQKEDTLLKASLREYKTLKPYLYRYRWQYGFGFFCLILIDAAQVAIPQFMGRAVDLISRGNFEWKEVVFIALAMTALMAVICFGRFVWRYFIHGSARRIETEIRGRLFEHLMGLSFDFYQKNKIGDLMARSTNDIGAVRMAIGWGAVSLVDGVIMVVSILIIMFVQDPRTAAFSIMPLPVVILLIFLFGKAVGKRFFRAQETYSAMSDTVQETFAGIRVVKSFVKEWWFIRKFADTNDDYRSANMALVKLFGAFFPFISFLSGITTLLLLLVGGSRVVEGFLSPGALVALFSYLQMLIWPLVGAGFMVNMLERGAVALSRVNEVLETPPSIVSPENPRRPEGGTVDGTPALSSPVLELRNLSFAYPGGEPVLEGINLTVPRGALVGILGRTGAGKSTLIKTLVRLVDPPPGTVFVSGIDVREWDLGELRRLFGVSPQDSYLFSDSVKNNIRYGLEQAGEDRLREAAGISALDRDLAGFTLGWDTLIGERGLTLSGGQKQRVAVSRAIIGSPELLILDDAFSAVDAETEGRILRQLPRERRGKTTVIISHRVSTLRNADLVVVLEKGRVSESGSPRELAARGGFYARMAALQQLGGAEEAADG